MTTTTEPVPTVAMLWETLHLTDGVQPRTGVSPGDSWENGNVYPTSYPCPRALDRGGLGNPAFRFALKAPEGVLDPEGGPAAVPDAVQNAVAARFPGATTFLQQRESRWVTFWWEIRDRELVPLAQLQAAQRGEERANERVDRAETAARNARKPLEAIAEAVAEHIDVSDHVDVESEVNDALTRMDVPDADDVAQWAADAAIEAAREWLDENRGTIDAEDINPEHLARVCADAMGEPCADGVALIRRIVRGLWQHGDLGARIRPMVEEAAQAAGRHPVIQRLLAADPSGNVVGSFEARYVGPGDQPSAPASDSPQE